MPAASAMDLDAAKLRLSSANVLVLDAKEGKAVYAKAADEVTPIASLTKLMTAMVVLDAKQPMDEVLSIDMDDFDYLKGSHSRLRMGTSLTRAEMLRLALMSSENRAASALARHYPGGTLAFVAAMNEKAISLGMTRTHYDDSTGLSPSNVSTANDLAKLVRAAADYDVIRDYSTTPSHYVEVHERPHARIQQLQRADQEQRVGHPAAEDGLYPRGRALRGDARHHREQADGDRAARFDRQVHPRGRRAARQALAGDGRVDARDRVQGGDEAEGAEDDSQQAHPGQVRGDQSPQRLAAMPAIAGSVRKALSRALASSP